MPENRIEIGGQSINLIDQSEYTIWKKNRVKPKVKSPETTICADGLIRRIEDCVMLNNMFYAKDSDQVVKDAYNNETYILKETAYPVYKSIKLTNENRIDSNNSEIGYTSWISRMIPFYLRGNIYNSTNIQNLLTNGFIEDYKNGLFVLPSEKGRLSKGYVPYLKFDAIKSNKFFKIPEHLSYKFGIQSPSYLISEGKKYTFGVELETCDGKVPEYIHDDINVKCVYDGSLKDENGNVFGGEYVTDILTGDTGINQLQKICNELSKRCKVNHKCGVHIHVGNIDFNKEFIVYSYSLAQMLENDIFSMLPASRRSNKYCRPIRNRIKFNFPSLNKDDYSIFINEKYNEIFSIISDNGKAPSKIQNKYLDHPLGHKCGYNTNSARYWWINFVPAMFNTRKNGAYTLEFRPHSGTTNFIKVKNWLLICIGFVYFCENNRTDIINGYIMMNGVKEDINLINVMKVAYPKKYKKLVDYIENRYKKFSIENSTSETSEYEVEDQVNELKIKELI
jgi:hypothetical protein